jgi:hypothetical protein
MSDSPLPTDNFSRRLRELQDNPGAMGSGSTIHARDFYGNLETWVVETYRTEDGRETVFAQRNAADGALRLVIPPEVAAALSRHRDQLVTRTRKRAARRGLETKRARGIDPAAALRKHTRREAAVGARERKARS